MTKTSNTGFSQRLWKNTLHRSIAVSPDSWLSCLVKSIRIKIWTKFESDQFKQRFGEGAIIPVWYADAVPGAFDESKRVGGMAFDPWADLASQVQEIVQVLGAKLEEERQVEVENSDVAAVDSA